MAIFVFETSVEVTGVFGAYAHAQGEIELSDDEIDILIRLMRKDKTTMDYRKLNLEEEDPELYEKIDNAYHDAAYEAEGHYSINYGIEEHEGMEGLEYDVNELILYSRDHCGYRKRYADDVIRRSEVDDFDNWFRHYLDDLKVDDALEFIDEHTMIGLNLYDTELGAIYTCDLPNKLKKIEKGWKSKK